MFQSNSLLPELQNIFNLDKISSSIYSPFIFLHTDWFRWKTLQSGFRWDIRSRSRTRTPLCVKRNKMLRKQRLNKIWKARKKKKIWDDSKKVMTDAGRRFYDAFSSFQCFLQQWRLWWMNAEENLPACRAERVGVPLYHEALSYWLALILWYLMDTQYSGLHMSTALKTHFCASSRGQCQTTTVNGAVYSTCTSSSLEYELLSI